MTRKRSERWWKRRANLLDEHWLVMHGDTRAPKFLARQSRRALRLR